MTLRVGIIGYRHHAARLMNLVNSLEDTAIAAVFHPSKIIDHPCATNEFNDLYDSDAILISSPNHTHAEYLKRLLCDYRGYILCEKPPVISIKDLEFLETIPTKQQERLFFNFNFRFSTLNEALTDPRWTSRLGKRIHFHLTRTHGLAFTPGYSESWRADGATNKHAILDTVAIHYLDLLCFHFGKIKVHHYSANIHSNRGTAFDTAHVALTFEDGATGNIYVSYAGAHQAYCDIVGTDGRIVIEEGQMRLLSPRDTFNPDGLFVDPPVVNKRPFVFRGDYERSLQKAMDFFINHVRSQRPLPPDHFRTSLRSNRLLLQLSLSIS